MKKNLVIILLLACCYNVAGRQYDIKEQLIIARIKWFLKVKDLAAARSWPDFKGRAHDVALAYFTDKDCYIIDAGKVLSRRIKTIPFYKDKTITILRAIKRIDDRPFHMETAMDQEDSTVVYFNYPVMMCSDYESTRENIPDVNSLQEWASMVVHEYFHGFQLKHKRFARYGNNVIKLRGSQVQSFYRTYPWFKEHIDRENQLLLSCLTLSDKDTLIKTLRSFVALREERRKMLEDTLHNDFAKQEDFYEKLEGTAKYVELNLLPGYRGFPTDSRLQLLDTAYKAGAYNDLHLERDTWRYDPESINYFYATGFNILRILDKLGIDFRKHCFDDNTLTPYGLLAAYVNKNAPASNKTKKSSF